MNVVHYPSPIRTSCNAFALGCPTRANAQGRLETEFLTTPPTIPPMRASSLLESENRVRFEENKRKRIRVRNSVTRRERQEKGWISTAHRAWPPNQARFYLERDMRDAISR